MQKNDQITIQGTPLEKDDTHSFVIRIWNEATDQDGKVVDWRGSIDHVGSHKRLYFYDLNGIVRFIQEQTGAQRQANTSWWKTLLNRWRDGLSRITRKRTS